MRIIVPVMALLAVGCAVKPTYLNRDIYTVAVLPPFNGTNYMEASRRAWPYVEAEVARRGYGLIPRATVEAFYEKNRFNLAEEVQQYSAQELAKEFACDAVVYSNVAKWDRMTLLLYVQLKVALEASLLDGKTGEGLWEGEGSAGDADIGRDAVVGTVGSVIAGLDALERFCGPAASACFRRMPLPGYEPQGK